MFFGPPSDDRLEHIATKCIAYLKESGFVVLDVLRQDLEKSQGLGIVSRADSHPSGDSER